jgi:hypothetical protein
MKYKHEHAGEVQVEINQRLIPGTMNSKKHNCGLLFCKVILMYIIENMVNIIQQKI